MRVKFLIFLLSWSLATPFFYHSEAVARAPKRFNYVGVDTCMLCHKSKELGDQYDVWINTPHSKAFYTLGTPEAKELASKLGIKDPQQDGRCLRCHSTCHVLTVEKVATDLRPEDVKVRT